MVFSRLGVYLRLPGVDVDRFSEAMQGSGILGYIDTLSGEGGRVRKGSEVRSRLCRPPPSCLAPPPPLPPPPLQVAR